MKTKINVVGAALLLIGSAAPVSAFSACDDLWYSRNSIFDNRGFCFRSPLARTVFDTGCKNETELPPAALSRVNTFKDRERALGCHVDTQRTSLEIVGFADRRHTFTQPVATGTESACIGLKWTKIDLLDTPLGRGEQHIVGTAYRGTTLLFRYDDVGPYAYVTVYDQGVYNTQGWMDMRGVDLENECEALAG